MKGYGMKFLRGFSELNAARQWVDMEGSDWTPPTQFPQGVPVEEVEKLFDFNVEVWNHRGEMVGDYITNTWTEKRTVRFPRTTLFINDKTREVIGTWRDPNRHPSNFKETILDFATELVGDASGIATAGLIDGGGIGWMQVALTQTYGPSEARFQPYIAITDSNCQQGGAWKATQGANLILCSNTLRSFFSKKEGVVKKVHKGRKLTVVEVRERLELLHVHAEWFEQQLQKLLDTPITPRQTEKFLNHFYPDKMDEDTQEVTVSKETSRNTLRNTYENSHFCKPFKGTVFGIIQAVNTKSQWGHYDGDLDYMHGHGKQSGTKWESNIKDNLYGNKIRSNDQRAIDILSGMGLMALPEMPVS